MRDRARNTQNTRRDAQAMTGKCTAGKLNSFFSPTVLSIMLLSLFSLSMFFLFRVFCVPMPPVRYAGGYFSNF